MKRPGFTEESVPVVLRGGPSDGAVMRVPKLQPEIRIPLSQDFADIASVKPIDDTQATFEVAIYVRTDDRETLQLPPPAPKDARRIGFTYRYDRTEK